MTFRPQFVSCYAEASLCFKLCAFQALSADVGEQKFVFCAPWQFGSLHRSRRNFIEDHDGNLSGEKLLYHIDLDSSCHYTHEVYFVLHEFDGLPGDRVPLNSDMAVQSSSNSFHGIGPGI